MQKEEILQNLNLEAYYVSELPSLKVRNNKAQALCPFHEDSKPSLSIDLTTGSFHCFGCAKKGSVFDFCMEKQGIGFKEANNALAGFTGLLSEPQKEIVKTYNYKDESGNLLYQAVRYEPKDFTQRRPDGKGGWIWNLEGVRRIPYNLPDVIKAQEVFIVEGEKDADNLNAIDLIATTCPGGANKWRKEYNEYFKGKKVVVIPDNDEPGRKHGQDIAKNLKGIAESIKIIEFPGLPEKGDITDWIAGGGTKERLLELVKEAPEWQPPKEEPEETDRDSNLLPVCSFPFEVFPLQLREIINKLSTSLHIAPDVASACLLPIIGSAVGNSVRVSPKDGWEEAPFIWLALIAKTGYGKSPLVQKLFKPLECLQGKAYQEYKEKGQEYERLLALAKKDKLLFPEKPKLKQYLVSDFTIEALSEVFEGDSRGVIITADELAGLIWGLNQYKGKGNDRQHILQLWNAHSWKIDRKTGVKFIPNTGASIIGGIQPRV
ncbi:MAG: DUF3987 domain-containing protein, partial [Proteobacteria bacterium]|nr:DUF3987 domain-containing protein [Pseudomonadota bacterium]